MELTYYTTTFTAMDRMKAACLSCTRRSGLNECSITLPVAKILVSEMYGINDFQFRYIFIISPIVVLDTQFGNRLAVIYGMKMITYAMRKPFTFTCGKAEGESPSGAAYLMQLNSNVPGPVPNRDGVEYSPEEVCLRFCRGTFCSWYHDSLDLASDAMIADWKHLSSSEVLTMKDHDDAVIHLRLGDGLYSTVGANEGKGIFPHGTYIELLKQAVFEKGHLSSIGIVTAPFKGSQLRSFDVAYTSLSEMIVQDLIEALKIEFPFAEIKIHNSPYGSILESLSRVVNARKVAICGCSTFCPYALLARDGLGFMYHPSGAQNQWVRNAAQWHPNFRLFDTPMLNGLVIANHKYSYSMPQERVIRWLREQDPHVGNVDITKGPIFRYKMK